MCQCLFQGGQGVLSHPPSPPWKLAFPKFDMGLPPLICIYLLNFAAIHVCLPPLERSPEINPVKSINFVYECTRVCGGQKESWP